MEFEVLKRSHIKRNIIIAVIVIDIISAIILNFTRAKYRVTDSIEIVNGTVNYTPYDFKLIAMYQENDSGEYVEIESMPSSGYIINEEMSYCTLDNVNHDKEAVLYTDDRGQHVFAGLKKNSKCYLYFDEKPITNIQELIASYTTKLTRSNFSTTVTDTTTGTIYYADTSKGRTYYFAGNPTDNWVEFAGFYWRIIRINEDGSIRLIYNGTGTTTTGTSTQIGTSRFNSGSSDNMHVGLKYTSGDAHGTGTNSTILIALNNWYTSNLSSYATSIDGNAGFCNDRTTYSGSGAGTNSTIYAAYNRLVTNKTPSFECSDNSDLYTTSGSEDGNGALTYPIGLITADEVAFAGGVWRVNNSSYYLYTAQRYYTMTPARFTGAAYVFDMFSDGYPAEQWGRFSEGVRPVINLRSDVTITDGDGTSSNPYIIGN